MLRRKSLHRSRNQKRARKPKSPAALAWELETRRLNRVDAAEQAARDLAEEGAQSPIAPPPRPRDALRFRITVECLTDGERVRFTSAEGPHGLTVSPSLAGRKVAAILRHYRPIK